MHVLYTRLFRNRRDIYFRLQSVTRSLSYTKNHVSLTTTNSTFPVITAGSRDKYANDATVSRVAPPRHRTLNNWRGLMFVIKKKHCLSPGESKNEPQNVISLKTNTKVNKFASVFAIATTSIVWRAWQVALCEMLTNVRWPLLETSGFIENMIT